VILHGRDEGVWKGTAVFFHNVEYIGSAQLGRELCCRAVLYKLGEQRQCLEIQPPKCETLVFPAEQASVAA